MTLPPEPSYSPFPANPAPTGGAGSGPTSGDRQPSTRGYWIGCAIGALGVVVSVVWFIATIAGGLGAVDDYPRFSVPGSRTMELKAETYKVFIEYPGASEDIGQFREVSNLQVETTEGRPVTVSSSSTSESYSWNGREGRSIAQFTPPRAGSYVVSADPGTIGSSGGVAIAVGRGIELSMVGQLLGAVGLGGVAVLIAIVFIVITAVRRGGWKRRQLRPAPLGYPGYPSGPAYPGGPGYPGPAGFGAPSGQPERSRLPRTCGVRGTLRASRRWLGGSATTCGLPAADGDAGRVVRTLGSADRYAGQPAGVPAGRPSS